MKGRPAPLRERFEEKVNRDTPDGCWLWTGYIGPNGYGRISMDAKSPVRNGLAHRVAYELYIGPIPEGLSIDHLCRVRYCVNPAHLEAVPIRVNILRGDSAGSINARKTACIRGHTLSPPNGFVDALGKRQCRTCYRAYQAKWHRDWTARKRVQRMAG